MFSIHPIAPRTKRETEELHLRGDELCGNGQFEAGLAHYRAALTRGADPGERGGQRWICAMSLGRFESAWRECDLCLASRGQAGSDTGPVWGEPSWDGAPLDGRRVLIRCEHGLGDAVQFARFLPEIARGARSVIVRGDPRLEHLFRSFGGVDEFISFEHDLPPGAGDARIELMEAAHILRFDALRATPSVPYVRPNPEAARRALEVLEPRGEPLIGVNWLTGGWNPHRNITPAELEPLFDIPGARFISLAKDAGPDLTGAGFNRAVERRPELMIDLEATAGLVGVLDYVISVDTMIAHLAGAMGRPLALLLPRRADWRWLAGAVRSPWYPSARLFRQTREGSWREPISQVAGALRGWIKNGRGRAREPSA